MSRRKQTKPPWPEVGPAKPCDHDWRRVHDWVGDHNVVNGTMSFTYYECRRCGDTQDEQPDDYDHDEPEPWEDEERKA